MGAKDFGFFAWELSEGTPVIVNLRIDQLHETFGPKRTSATNHVAAAQLPRSGRLNEHRIYAPFQLPNLLGFSDVARAMTYSPTIYTFLFSTGQRLDSTPAKFAPVAAQASSSRSLDFLTS